MLSQRALPRVRVVGRVWWVKFLGGRGVLVWGWFWDEVGGGAMWEGVYLPSGFAFLKFGLDVLGETVVEGA